MRVGLLFNAASGSTTENQLDIALEALERHGARVVCVYAISDLETLREDAVNLDLVVVLGGDGTARAVAAAAAADGPPLILLPGGTLNVLPKALLGELVWPEALEAALTRGEVRRLVGGTANGEPFFIAAMFGAPTLMARVREAVREGRWIRAWRSFQLLNRRLFSRGLVGRPDTRRMREAEAVGVLCPSFSGLVDGDSLEWVRLEAQNYVDLLRVGVRTLGPDWRTDPVIHASLCRTGSIHGKGLVTGTLDGEPRTFQTPIRIVYKDDGPNVITLPH
jgi:diacylglycerol kinase family enzyme